MPNKLICNSFHDVFIEEEKSFPSPNVFYSANFLIDSYFTYYYYSYYFIPFANDKTMKSYCTVIKRLIGLQNESNCVINDSPTVTLPLLIFRISPANQSSLNLRCDVFKSN